MYNAKLNPLESYRYIGISLKKNGFVIGLRPEKTSLSCQNRKELNKGHSFDPSGRRFLWQYVVLAAILLPENREFVVTIILQGVIRFSIDATNGAVVIDQVVVAILKCDQNS